MGASFYWGMAYGATVVWMVPHLRGAAAPTVLWASVTIVAVVLAAMHRVLLGRAPA